MQAVNVAFLPDLQQMGVIARRTLLEMLTRAGILPDDVDVDAEQDRIAQELSAEAWARGTPDPGGIIGGGRRAGEGDHAQRAKEKAAHAGRLKIQR